MGNRPMTETTAREIDCVLCKDTYAPVLGPEEGEKSYRIYCSSCVNWVEVGRSNPLRVGLRVVLGLRGEALSLAVQTCLSACSCGSSFSCDAGGRCPVCIEKIERETKSSTSGNKDFTNPTRNEGRGSFLHLPRSASTCLLLSPSASTCLNIEGYVDYTSRPPSSNLFSIQKRRVIQNIL